MNYYLQNGETFTELKVRESEGQLLITNGTKVHGVAVTNLDNGYYSVIIDNLSFLIRAEVQSKDVLLVINHRERKLRVLDARQKLEAEMFGATDQDEHAGDIMAPMPGMILRIEVKPGDTVESGQPLLVMEAMKMENEIRAKDAGMIKSVNVKPQQAVEKDDLLITIEK